MLILRPDNLGDVVLFSGALKAIREKWATSKITICVKRFATDYLELCPYLDNILVWEEVNDFLYRPYYRRQMLRLTRLAAGWVLGSLARSAFDLSTHCDLSFDLLLLPVRSPSWDHHMFARAVQAPVRIGISGDWCNQTAAQDRAAESIYAARMPAPYQRERDSELKVHAKFLRFLGVEVSLADLWPRVWTDRSDRLWAHQQISSTDNSSCLRLGVVAGVNSPETKMYPLEKIAEAIGMVRDSDFSCIIMGSSEDVATSDEVERSLRRYANVVTTINLAGKTNIRQLIECLRLCDLVIAVDSAPLHIATALRKPTVGIMGGGHFGRFYPWGDPEINRVVCKPMDCYFCNWNCPKSDGSCVKDIPPSAVTREIEYLARRLKERPMDV